MKVLIRARMPGAEEALVPAEVEAVRAEEADLLTEDGARVSGWRGAIFGEDGEEISRERLKRELAAKDITAMRERIEALENMMTETEG